MITFKELQTLADIFSKPVPDNPILSDIEDTLECAVIEGRTRFRYVSLKYDKEVADEAIRELEKCERVLMDHEIAVIDYPDGNIKTIIGDGKSKVLECKELTHPISVVNYIPKKIFLCDDLSKLKKIPFHSEDSIKIFLPNYSIEFDETNSFPKYLFRGRNECVGTLIGDNLISELCNKILELSSKGEKNETTE